MSRRPIRRFSVREALDLFFQTDEDGIGVEPEIEEDVSEIEDNDPDFDPDHHETEQSTYGEEEAPEEEAPGEEAPVEDTPEVTFQSKDGNLLWYSSPQDRGGRTRGENIIRMSPGPTRYATSRVDDIKSSFQLFLPESIVEIILAMTNLEGGRVFADTWKALDQVDLQAYMGLLILAGVHRSNNEATKSLWDAESGRPIFRSTMSLQQFHVLSRIIRFDDRATRPFRWRDDKLAAIRNVWDRWVERLPLMYNPGPEVTVDERLVPFRGGLDVSACNAYVVWTAINPAWNQGKCFKRRLFLAELGKALVTPLIQRRQHLPRTPASCSLVRSLQAPATALATLPPKQGQKRKRCKLCAPRDNKTSLTCFKCDAYVCKTHCDLIAKCHSCV